MLVSVTRYVTRINAPVGKLASNMSKNKSLKGPVRRQKRTPVTPLPRKMKQHSKDTARSLTTNSVTIDESFATKNNV